MKRSRYEQLSDLIYLTGKTKTEFAEAVGIAPATLHFILTGQTARPSQTVIENMADVLEIEPRALRAIMLETDVA